MVVVKLANNTGYVLNDLKRRPVEKQYVLSQSPYYNVSIAGGGYLPALQQNGNGYNKTIIC